MATFVAILKRMNVKLSLIKTQLLFALILSWSVGIAQQDHSGHNHNHSHEGHSHDHGSHDHGDHSHNGHGHEGAHNTCGHTHDTSVFDPGETAFHHISDQNIYSIGPWHIPLPCFLYSHDTKEVDVFSSSKFHADAHGNGTMAYNQYVLFAGSARKVTDPSFPMGEVEIGHHTVFTEKVKEGDKEVEKIYLCYNDNKVECESKSTLDFGLFGGGITSFTDFSITKNVATMLLIFILLLLMFRSIAKKYAQNEGRAPSGMQGFIEPIFLFIQEEVCKPFLGHKWENYQPFIMSLFFFILALNLFGQVPFFGGSNVTGNLSVTFVLAIFAFFVVSLSGNKHYWEHIFWMPGIPAWVKSIVTPVEFLGVFIKPLTLMLRLFGNMTAGHMVIVIFVGLIFIFGQNGANPAAAYGTAIGSTLLTMFMMAIELLVAFIQAFVFAILTASYIGAAIEEAH